MNTLLDIFSSYGMFLGIPIGFLAIVFWVYRSSARTRYQEDGNLPFEEDVKPATSAPTEQNNPAN